MIWHTDKCRSEKLGDCTKEEAFGILDKFYELGGNFIDT